MELLNNVQVSNVASQGHCSVYFVQMAGSEGLDINSASSIMNTTDSKL